MYRTLVLCPGSRDKRGTRRGRKTSAGCPARKSKECNSPDPAGPHRSTWPHRKRRRQTEPRQRDATAENDGQGRHKPGGERSQPKRQQRDTVPFLSCPEAQKLRFQGARATPLRCAALSRPKPKRTRLCRAAPTGWTALRVGLGRHRVFARAGPPCCPPGGWRGRRAVRPAAACPTTDAARQPTASQPPSGAVRATRCRDRCRSA